MPFGQFSHATPGRTGQLCLTVNIPSPDRIRTEANSKKIAMTTSRRTTILIMFFLGGVIPVVLGGILGEYFPDWRWDYEPAHAIVEGIGSFSALIIATLILMMLRHHKLPPSYIWVTAGLLGMGVMDGFHAALYESNAFVWQNDLSKGKCRAEADRLGR